MNTMNKFFVGLLTLALALGGYSAFFKESKVTIINPETGEKVGALDQFARVFFQRGVTQGGAMSTSTGTITAYTTSRTDFTGTPAVISWLPNANQTITITPTSTLDYIPHVGDVANVYLRNASTTAASAITFAAATGVDLQFTEATGGDLVLNGLDWAKFTFIRTSEYVVTVLFDEMTEAD